MPVLLVFKELLLVRGEVFFLIHNQPVSSI